MADAPSAFWASHLVEPKRSYKYLVNWGDGSLPWYLIASVDLPKYELGESQAHALNHTFKYPGRITWQDTQMEIADSEAIDAVNVLMQKLLQAGYAYPTGPNQYKTISKQGAMEALGILRITEITWDEKIIGQWTFQNAWIKTFDAGKRAYESDDNVKIALTITYDWAEYSGNPVGSRPTII